MKNWKTSLIGLLLAFLNLFVAAVTSGVTPKDAAVSAAIAALGLFAKDYDTTGVGSTAEKKNEIPEYVRL